MCMYSLHAFPHEMEKAKIGQNLTKGEYKHHAAFVTDEGNLACIKHGTVLVIDNLQFAPGTAGWLIKHYEGKSMTVTFVDGSRSSWRRSGYAADCISFPPDSTTAKLVGPGESFRLPFHSLADGLVCHRARKVRKDKGVRKPRNLTKLMGLAQIRAEIDPNPKPEDAPVEAPSSEPPAEPQVNPVKEAEVPATTDPVAA